MTLAAVLSPPTAVLAARQRCFTSQKPGARSAARLSVRQRAGEGEPGQQAAEQAPPPASVAAPVTAAAEPSSSGKGLLAGGAVGLGVALFLAARLTVGGPSFAALEADSVPLDAALTNGRPTVLEFYAGTCRHCQALLWLAAAAAHTSRLDTRMPHPQCLPVPHVASAAAPQYLSRIRCETHACPLPSPCLQTGARCAASCCR